MRVLLLLLAFILAGASPVMSQADDKVVVPGVRIGRWTLETSIPDLMRMNGPPSARPSIVAAFVPGLTWYSWGHLGLSAATPDRTKTAYLAVYDGHDYGVRGIGIGSSRKTVLSAFGEPTIENDLFVQGRTITLLAYDRSGLAFFLHNDVVQTVLIFRPGNLQHLMADC